MERIPNGRYTKEFREEAVKLVTEGGLAIDAAARRLSLPKSTLANWVRAMKAGKLAGIREYIEIFYNRQRRQKKLGNLSPVAFGRRYYEQQMAA